MCQCVCLPSLTLSLTIHLIWILTFPDFPWDINLQVTCSSVVLIHTFKSIFVNLDQETKRLRGSRIILFTRVH